MANYTVRIDVCFTYNVEAENEDEAAEIAEAMLDEDMSGGRITETIVFDQEEHA